MRFPHSSIERYCISVPLFSFRSESDVTRFQRIPWIQDFGNILSTLLLIEISTIALFPTYYILKRIIDRFQEAWLIPEETLFRLSCWLTGKSLGIRTRNKYGRFSFAVRSSFCCHYSLKCRHISDEVHIASRWWAYLPPTYESGRSSLWSSPRHIDIY